MLTGKLPFGEVLPYQLGRYHCDPIAPSRHNPGVPIWLDHVVFKADEQVAQRAREAAQKMGKSLNQAVRDYLATRRQRRPQRSMVAI